MGHLAALLLAPALVTSACSDDGILADGINGGRVDAGFFSVDSGPDVGPRRDAEVRDAELAPLFFGIWLSPATSEPALRQSLLAQVQP